MDDNEQKLLCILDLLIFMLDRFDGSSVDDLKKSAEDIVRILRLRDFSELSLSQLTRASLSAEP